MSRSFLLGTLAALLLARTSLGAADANRLTHLDSDDPFYPQLGLARFTTPQWIGEKGVDAVVIISIDDLREPAKYEEYLRPIIKRLQQIDGRAPASIFCNQLAPGDARFPAWLAEGLSLEVHTLTHPCPLLGKGGFASAAQTYHGGVDLLSEIPGNRPAAFRMPCCDSMNSASPRFFAEVFARTSDAGRFLAIDSSVFCLLTPRDLALPRELVLDADGRERFRKYFPRELVPPRKVTFERFAGYIEDYPYPYVIGRGCWEFPCIVPSDWEAFNAHGAKNPRTTADWKAALDAVVLKQGVMTLVLHPHGWSEPQQIVELIDHAVAKYGKRVKFLNFREALARLEEHALAGQPLRGADGGDNGVRLLDVNGDGFVDVVIGNGVKQRTRLWRAEDQQWVESETPTHITADVRFGIVWDRAVMIASGEDRGGWHFTGKRWQNAPELVTGLGDGAVRLRDFDRDGECEILHATGDKTTVKLFREGGWEDAPLAWPPGVSLWDEAGSDNGVRFVDLNGDGFDDLLFSNERVSGIWLWNKEVRPDLGWNPGWSYVVRPLVPRSAELDGSRTIPSFTRGRGSNGAWFKDGHLVVQNEDTAALEGVVDRRSFQELIAFDIPPPLSPEDSLAAMRVRPGFTVELVATEPLVVDPIVFEWDARGRLWVVEMRDYPLGMDGKGSPGGVVKLLEDLDGDGRYEKATAFLDNLPCPTALIPWRAGVLVGAAPDILYAEDTDGDGRADVRRVVFTGFKAGNQQHRMNGFEWGLDGWIYGANGESGGTINGVKISGRDFRFRPDSGEFEAESGATQFGRRRDDWGNWFGNHNSTWLFHYTMPEHYLRRNPKLAVKSTREMLAQYDDASRVYPISEQPIRFNQPQSLGHVTSACSPSPYRDELFGPEFARSVFISEPVHNVVHREVLAPAGATFTSRRADDERTSEFLASRDVWFRPAMVKTGPDGALYIADMYRFVLEHPEWIAKETQARLDLRAGADKGRIYRVRPAGAELRKIPNLAELDTAALVAALDSPNGWQRDTAQRLLYERRGDSRAMIALQKLATTAPSARVRVQALATLHVLSLVAPKTVIAALRDADPAVRVQALRCTEGDDVRSREVFLAMLALEKDPDVTVRRQLAFSLAGWQASERPAALARMAEREGKDPLMRVAILSSVSADSPLMQKLAATSTSAAPVAPAPAIIPSTPDRGKVIASFAGLGALRGNAERGRELFRQLCATCHRFKNEGRELGPDLAMVAGKPDDWLLTAIFDPNQAIEDRYRGQHVTLKDGTELLGLIVAETGNNITLRTADGNERAVLRSDLREQKPLPRSLMPEGLESALKPQDAADLVKFLRQP